LNIWVSEDAQPDSKLPVLVYIHGGGFTGGCGHEKHFDGPVWPTRGVIAVTLNYRLGPMGFLCLPELAEEAGHTGNYGLFDQLCALRWIRDNIASFGGDPENITIMGQSAGAASVQLLSQSPLTKGLFQRAVMSGGCGLGGMMGGATPEKRYDFWKAVMALCGCQTLAQFRAVAPQKLFEAWDTAKKQVKGGGMAAAPVTDGLLSVKGGTPHEIPYMVGSNSHDIAPPVLYNMGRKFCARRQQPSYFWYFERNLPGDANGAWHSADLWYWFGTLPNCWRPMEERDYQLSSQMVEYLCNFVKHGDPGDPSLPAWLPCTAKNKAVLRLRDRDTAMGKPSITKMIHTMFTNKAVGE
jgi:para-nitrobenzyl esterase